MKMSTNKVARGTCYPIQKVQILIYIYNLLKKHNFSNSNYLIKTIKYLNINNFHRRLNNVDDYNGIIVISMKSALQLMLTDGHWVWVKFFSRNFCHRHTQNRWVKIYIDYNQKNDFCYVSSIFYHNLKEQLKTDNLAIEIKSEKLIYNLYLITRLFSIWNSTFDMKRIIYRYKSSLQPRYANQVSLASANTAIKLSNREVEKILENYFSTPKYVYLDDVIVIPLTIPLPLEKENDDTIHHLKYLYFIVTAFNNDKESSDGYLVSKAKTSLYLSGNKFTKVPYLLGPISYDEEKIPPCLRFSFNKVCSVIHLTKPLYSDINKEKKLENNNEKGDSLDSASSKGLLCYGHIILTGPSGSGKIRLIKLIAEKFSLHIKWINSLSIRGETSAATEAKIVQGFQDLLPHSIVVITRIGKLSEDRDGNPDPRAAIALRNQISDINSKSNPFIIGTDEMQENISDDLWSLFAYHLHISCPNEDERRETLLWLLNAYFEPNPRILYDKKGSKFNDTLQVVNHRTSGYYIGDLEGYILRVHRIFYERQNVENASKDKNNLPAHQDFLKILDDLQDERSKALGLPYIPEVLWKDVGGLEEAKKELINTIKLPIMYPTIISRSFRRSGILLYGPPGTGKTLLAKSVANECGLNFLSVKGPELINMYIGQSEENIRNVFSKAKAAAPCVIFFDELDSLAPKRGRSGDSGGVMDRIVSALLAELDDASSTSDVFVLAATNRPDMLDSALLRPGRFDKQIYLGVCQTQEGQVKILRAVTSKVPLSKDVSLSRVAAALPLTLTGADFSALVTDAFYIATNREINKLNEGSREEDLKVEVIEKDLLDAGLNLRPSVSDEELKMYSDIRKKRIVEGSQDSGMIS